MAAYEFEWDEAKAASNLRKHGVTFDEAMAISGDPLLLTIADPDHDSVERTLGIRRGERQRTAGPCGSHIRRKRKLERQSYD